jgi:hypothetical protein
VLNSAPNGQTLGNLGASFHSGNLSDLCSLMVACHLYFAAGKQYLAASHSVDTDLACDLHSLDSEGPESKMRYLRDARLATRTIFLVVVMVGGGWQKVNLQAQTQATSPDPERGIKQPKTTTMLADVMSLVKWVSDITPLLQSQGNEADRNKLRGKLKSISDQLASTETVNRAVVANLKSTSPNYSLLKKQLEQLHDADDSIAGSIAAIRSELHLKGPAS